jgi:hypothetical protein
VRRLDHARNSLKVPPMDAFAREQCVVDVEGSASGPISLFKKPILGTAASATPKTFGQTRRVARGMC